jgi:hypothetical protein
LRVGRASEAIRREGLAPVAIEAEKLGLPVSAGDRERAAPGSESRGASRALRRIRKFWPTDDPHALRAKRLPHGFVPALRPGELIEDDIVRKGIRAGVDEDGCVHAVRQGKAETDDGSGEEDSRRLH